MLNKNLTFKRIICFFTNQTSFEIDFQIFWQENQSKSALKMKFHRRF